MEIFKKKYASLVNLFLSIVNQFIETVNAPKFLKCAKWCIIALSQKTKINKKI